MGRIKHSVRDMLKAWGNLKSNAGTETKYMLHFIAFATSQITFTCPNQLMKLRLPVCAPAVTGIRGSILVAIER